MSNVQNIIELENKLSNLEQKKLLDFLENEFGFKNENVKIFTASRYISESEFADEIYHKTQEILAADFRED